MIMIKKIEIAQQRYLQSRTNQARKKRKKENAVIEIILSNGFEAAYWMVLFLSFDFNLFKYKHCVKKK